jgi:hypothetical protein
MSSVVLLELMASANDDSRRSAYEHRFRDYQRDNSLIPTRMIGCSQLKFCIGLLKVAEEQAEAD